MKPSRHTMAVFLDLTKAFDKVWKNKLLGKCFSEFDIKGTLKITYTALIRPILEYGYQIYQVAANTNLKKQERIQFSAGRIIPGLRHSCPNDIACYEADLQPLSLRREINMAKYVAKLKSFKPYNRSSNLLLNWTNNQRLKKDSPLGLIWKQGLADIEVEPSVPFNLLTPTTVLSNVTFNEDLKVKFIKHEEHPELLRQLVLEIINNISPRALVIYTDGSKSDSGRTGSGIFMKTSTGEFRYRFRNPDHSSVFRSELTAISEALSLTLDFKVPDVWILTDSRRVFDNLRKCIAFVMTSKLAEILPFFLLLTLDIPLPLEESFILLIFLGIDMFPALSLIYEKAEKKT
ncbi:putative RNA-directed DNA polymerase from transposon BS [Caerostris extrusa]|uniref:RNA-directed DNA polymerase from transposon BS n=1 Tax=Caerostris extrusa TaxID=172846 RepID=A0AAV4WFA8_CAEEX|nr:putative RNA-directed DNA polymerase from transposon BS [Caerostris extrusa]